MRKAAIAVCILSLASCARAQRPVGVAPPGTTAAVLPDSAVLAVWKARAIRSELLGQMAQNELIQAQNMARLTKLSEDQAAAEAALRKVCESANPKQRLLVDPETREARCAPAAPGKK